MRYCAHYSSTNITTFNDLNSYMKSYQYSHFRDEETVRVLQPASDQSRIHTQVCFTLSSQTLSYQRLQVTMVLTLLTMMIMVI